jgi:hypothetical protein
MQRKHKSKIQSIIFEKLLYTPEEARKWLKKNEFKPIKHVDKTKNFLRYRIRSPKKGSRYRMIEFTDGIKAVIMF